MLSLRVILLAVLRAVWAVTAQLVSIPAYCGLLLVISPLYYARRQLFWTIEGVLFRWLLVLVCSWGYSAGYTVSEMGDDVSQITDQKCVVIVNHQSTGDVPVIMVASVAKEPVAKEMDWIMDYIFKFTTFGVPAACHGDFFISQGKESRRQQLAELKRYVRETFAPRNRKWLVLFPEGGFLQKRLAGSHTFAKKNSLPVLNHVTLPRTGAMQVVLENLSDGHSDKSIKWIIDVTIGYANNQALNLQTFIFGHRPPAETVLYYRAYPASQVPHDTVSLTRWLYQRYEEKDLLLDEFYKTGKFPPSKPGCHGDQITTIQEPRPVRLSTRWIIQLHVFYAVCFYVQFRAISSVIGRFC